MSSDATAIEALFDETRSFPPPHDFAEQANAKRGDLRGGRTRLPGVLGIVGAQARVDDAVHDHARMERTVREMVRRRGGSTPSVNCLDRHVRAGKGDQIAFYFEGEPGDRRTVTYAQLLDDVCRFANGLRKLGIRKGDRVAIYMPMIPELPVALLACARIGAAHSVIFGGFSPESIVDRVNDAQCVALITCDWGWRRGQQDPAQAQLRRGDGADALDSPLHRRAPDRRLRGQCTPGATLVERGRRRSAHDLRARADGCRGSALPALHERHDGQAQGHQAHDGGISDAVRDDARARLRLASRIATSTGAPPTSAG